MTAPVPVGDGDRLVVLTTRSRLKRARDLPSMLVATMRVRRQLDATEGVVRWASVVAGPTELWTISVWRSRHHMQEFMHSGAHSEIMWLFTRWLRSFWLMRWQPGTDEVGTWDGTRLAPPPAPVELPADDELDGAARRALLDQALAELPQLRAATGPTGAAAYDSSPNAQRRRGSFGGASGALVRLGVRPWRTLGALTELRRLRDEVCSPADALRCTVGVGRPGEVYLLALWADAAGPTRLLASTGLRSLHERLGERCWAIGWTPENEFGHWDGLRVRRQRVRQRLPMTAALAALDDDSVSDVRRIRERLSWRRGAGARRAP